MGIMVYSLWGNADRTTQFWMPGAGLGSPCLLAAEV